MRMNMSMGVLRKTWSHQERQQLRRGERRSGLRTLMRKGRRLLPERGRSGSGTNESSRLLRRWRTLRPWPRGAWADDVESEVMRPSGQVNERNFYSEGRYRVGLHL